MGKRHGPCCLSISKGGVEVFYTEDFEAIMEHDAQNCRERREAEPGLELINQSNIASQKLTGLGVEIIESKNRQLAGLVGTVYFETMNTFYLYTKKGERQVPKKGSVWEFAVMGSKFRVDGSGILKRPAERIE